MRNERLFVFTESIRDQAGYNLGRLPGGGGTHDAVQRGIMVLLSRRAPWQKRTVVAVAPFIALISVSCFGRPALLPVQSTPYDRQMTRVYPILGARKDRRSQTPVSLDEVNGWMSQLRAIPYQFTRYWKTPTEVDSGQAADCKAKAIALYAQLRRCGAQGVRMLIGKRHIYDMNTHAWVEWDTSIGCFTLDPTFNAVAIRTSELDPMMYVALYAYDGEHKYRAGRSGVAAPNTRVAAGYNNHSYGPIAPATATTGIGVAQAGFTKFGSPVFYPPMTQSGASTTPQNTQASNQMPSSQRPSAMPYLARPVTPPTVSNPASANVVYQRSVQYQAPSQSSLTNQFVPPATANAAVTRPTQSVPTRSSHRQGGHSGHRHRHHRIDG